MLVATAPLAAQSVPTDRFSVNHFVPAIGPGNYIQVDGASVGGHLSPTVELLVDYAHRPFVLYGADCPSDVAEDCDLGKGDVDIVKYQLTTTVAATLSFVNRVQVGLSVPFVYTNGEGFAASVTGRDQPYVYLPGGYAFGPGDPRLSVKVRLVGDNQGFLLGLMGYATAPLADVWAEGYGLGYNGVTAGGSLIAELKLGRFRAAANVGGGYKPPSTLLATEIGSEFTYGVGAGFDITSLLGVVTEVVGSTRFSDELDENPVEWRLAGKLTQGDFVVQLGGGAGLVSGAGIPNFRVIGGAAFQPSGVDSDGDGVGDKVDACPSEPEDKDGYMDEDGCPEADNDGDGIDDAADKCPNEAEDPDGFEDTDGCPDRDNDGDGIPDGYDSCPNEPEDMDGDRDTDGCPDNDRDRDGVEDDKDKCPDEPEDTDGYGDEDGCPEVDFDNDGVPDDQDQCPDEPETKNGFDDDDGCPDEAPPPQAPQPGGGGKRRR
ncbi:MAG TPA: thrombospondin type 3 repeat-containing protein [Polyangiales bacterium]|nr:thrombospondin type 3 repeat-containing protein [Polyangiales bacterium]